MRISKLNKLLNLWESNNLISAQQNKNISEFMKERQKEQFFRFIKWFFILGALWLVFGIMASVVQLFDLSFMEKIKEFIISVFVFITKPVVDFLVSVFADNLKFFLWGILSFICSGIIFYILSKLKKDNSIDKLNLSDTQKSILKNYLWLEIIGCVLLSAGFILFNKLLISPEHNYYKYSNKIFPIWHFVGAVTFIVFAYRKLKVSFLLFGIYFISLTVGMFSGYGYACYWIGTSRPVVQILAGIILILVGHITELKLKENDYIKENFATVYNWTGLLLTFIALWIISLWGFDFSKSYSMPDSIELWCANILFIASSLWAMYWGARNENKLFFNYGLTFFIIETYTIFCVRLWEKLPVSIASLLFGLLLIITGKILVKIYLKKTK